MARKSPLLKYARVSQDILMDGCGDCTHCSAHAICGGCNLCPKSKCQSSCENCSVRCWRHQQLNHWFEDVNGLSFDSLTCPTVFTADLPDYIPQIQNNAFGYDHPAYIINIHRLLSHQSSRWCYRAKGIKPHFRIPETSKALLSFCSTDPLLERIWTHSNKWQNDESFWDGIAAYNHSNGIDGSLSIEFSCFADAPRMDHLLNIKRNIISAHELSNRGIPTLLDAIIRTDLDLKRTVAWGREHGVLWYLLNFQRTKPVPWLYDLISGRIEQILQAGGKAIISGLGNLELMSSLLKQYRGNISLTNTVVSMKTNYYQEFIDGAWQKSNKPQAELFAHNMQSYCEALGTTS